METRGEYTGEDVSQFLQAVLDALSAHIAILDDQGIIRAVNAPWRRFADENGLTWADYGIGRDYLGAFDAASGEGADDAREVARGIRAVMSGGMSEFRYEYPCDSPDQQRWFMMWATPVALSERPGVVVSHEDITARKLSEMATEAARAEAERARAAEVQQRLLSERRRAIAAALKDVLAALNSDRSLDSVLDAILKEAQALLLASSVTLVPAPTALVIESSESSPVDSERLQPYYPVAIRDLLAQGRSTGYVFVEGTGNAGNAQCESAGARLMAPIRVDGQDYAVLVVCYDGPRTFVQDEVDLVADLALQTALAVENDRLRQRIWTSAVEAERTRLLRELHDSVSQSLFSANLIADTLPRIWEEHPAEALQGLEEVRQLTRSALLEMRGLLLDLGPAVLAEQPLDVLLQRLIDVLSGRTQVPIQRSLGSGPPLPSRAKVTLYRIAEEALNNAVKHSSAAAISVGLLWTGTGLCLSIRDDGRGFDPESVAPGHLGLGIMRQRAKEIGAAIDILSDGATGTQVTVTWNDMGEGGHDA
ncbi:MAG: histidine kinase [Anaerolineae bacterium]